MARAAHGAVAFTFDRFPERRIEEFGWDLVKHDAFVLPARTCYFEWPFESVGEIFAGQGDQRTQEPCHTDRSALLVMPGVDDDQIILQSFARYTGREHWGVGMPWVMRISKRREAALAGEGPRPPMLFDGLASFYELVACVAALSCKGVDRETIAPSRQVRRHAERRGEPIPKGHTVIRLPVASREHQGGHPGIARASHASPIPHFRRGHVRRLDSGRLTKVRPAFVMAEPHSIPIREVRL